MMHEDGPTHPALHDIPALVEFAVVARWEHVTRAATELGLPQPTLSRRIARLERVVGVPLFARHGRRLELTRAGRALATIVDRALAELEQGVAEVTRSVDPHAGTVALAFLNTMGIAVVPRLLRQFRTTHPGVAFQLVQDGHDAVLSRLRNREVDLCLTSPLPREPDLAVRTLHRQPLRLTAPEDHPLTDRPDAELAAAAGEQFVGFKPGYGMRTITEDWCRRAGFTPRLAFEGEDVATVRGLVAAGLGVALLPATARPAPGTVELAVTDLPVSRTIGLAWLSRRELPPPAREFHAFLSEHGAALVAAAIDDTVDDMTVDTSDAGS